MFTRRGFINGALGAGAGLALAAQDSQWAAAQTPAAQSERNKAVIRRFSRVAALLNRGWTPLPAALGGYMLYLHEHVGDWLSFQHAQQLYWTRRTGPLGPLSGLWGWRGFAARRAARTASSAAARSAAMDS